MIFFKSCSLWMRSKPANCLKSFWWTRLRCLSLGAGQVFSGVNPLEILSISQVHLKRTLHDQEIAQNTRTVSAARSSQMRLPHVPSWSKAWFCFNFRGSLAWKLSMKACNLQVRSFCSMHTPKPQPEPRWKGKSTRLLSEIVKRHLSGT